MCPSAAATPRAEESASRELFHCDVSRYNHQMPRLRLDVGQRFARLVVLGSASPTKDRNPRVKCRCDCGRETIARIDYIKTGHTKSCGCQRMIVVSRIDNTRHGLSKTREHRAWVNMNFRCTNSSCRGFENYGGRGIRVCTEWRESFEAFFRDMGPRPSAKHSLDRIDNDGNYEPGNVRWALSRQQNSNKRDVVPVTYRGETMPLMEWSRRLGIHQATLWARLFRRNWTVERALATDPTLYHHR